MKPIYILTPLVALIALVGFPLAIRGMIRNIRDVRSGHKTHSQILKPALLRLMFLLLAQVFQLQPASFLGLPQRFPHVLAMLGLFFRMTAGPFLPIRAK